MTPETTPGPFGAEDRLPVIGWREWIALPELGVPAVKAKIDSGARSCSLHAIDVHVVRRKGRMFVRFGVHPFQRDTTTTVTAEAELLCFRSVRSSGGHETVRPVVITDVELLGQRWPIELTLAGRDAMGFRMLIGRQAIRHRFLIDPGRSFLAGKKPARRRIKRKKTTKKKRPD